MLTKYFNENDFLEGNYPLQIRNRLVKPEEFLELFENKRYYEDVRKFIRRVDNDTGIPFLKKDEYIKARRIIPKPLLQIYESGIISIKGERVYLRGENYYLNYNRKLANIIESKFSLKALELLEDSLKKDLVLAYNTLDILNKAKTIDSRMIVGSLIDLYKNHLMILFTGLYESMNIDSDIDVKYYACLRQEVETVIDNYYNWIIKGEPPKMCANIDTFYPIIKKVKQVIINQNNYKKQAESIRGKVSINTVYDDRKYLSREFDHPGRIVLYASHLLSQITQKEKKYDLLVNLLNGSAEIGLAIQTIDRLLDTKSIYHTTIFEVDFARYSKKDRKHESICNYKEFERIAIPSQLRANFKNNADNKNILLVDDNLNTGQSLYNVRLCLEEIAKSVDISTVEIISSERVKEILFRKNSNIDVMEEIKLTELDLTYPAIGFWRDQIKLNEAKIIQNLINIAD